MIAYCYHCLGPIPIGKMVLNLVGCPSSIPHPSSSELKNVPKYVAPTSYPLKLILRNRNLHSSGFGQILHEVSGCE